MRYLVATGMDVDHRRVGPFHRQAGWSPDLVEGGPPQHEPDHGGGGQRHEHDRQRDAHTTRSRTGRADVRVAVRVRHVGMLTAGPVRAGCGSGGLTASPLMTINLHLSQIGLSRSVVGVFVGLLVPFPLALAVGGLAH